MIEVKIILLVAAFVCFAVMLKLTFDLRLIFRDMDRTFVSMDHRFDKIIDTCNQAIAICEDASRDLRSARKKLIKSKRRS